MAINRRDHRTSAACRRRRHRAPSSVGGRRAGQRFLVRASLFALPCSLFDDPQSSFGIHNNWSFPCRMDAVEHNDRTDQSYAEHRPTSGTKRSHPFLRKAQASLLARQLRGQQALRRLHDGQRCTCPAWRVHSFRCGRRPSLRFSKSFRTSPAGTHRGLRE